MNQHVIVVVFGCWFLLSGFSQYSKMNMLIDFNDF